MNLEKSLLLILVILASCSGDREFGGSDAQRVETEVREMLNSYYADVNRQGLTAEFRYLDDSPGFFWIPPGYGSPLSYDSVRAEVGRNALRYRSVSFQWDTLQIYPLTGEIADYSGIVRGEMTDTTGVRTPVSLLESGTVIRRSGGWKILNGHTTVLPGGQQPMPNQNEEQTMGKVTGVGGIFFKSEDPQKLKEWYSTHLGLETDQWGTNFEWRQADGGTEKGFTQWSPFSASTDYFEPSTRDFMINYRVENLEALLEELKKEGVTILDDVAEYEYGKFVHILDGEGNKIELWEPNDVEYDKIVEGRTK